MQRHHAGGHHPGLCPCLPCLDVCPGSSVLVPSIHGQAPLSGISRPVFQFVVVCLPQNSAPGGQGCQPGAQCSNRLGVPQQPKGSLLFGRVPALPRPAPPCPAPLSCPAPPSCPCTPSQLAQAFPLYCALSRDIPLLAASCPVFLLLWGPATLAHPARQGSGLREGSQAGPREALRPMTSILATWMTIPRQAHRGSDSGARAASVDTTPTLPRDNAWGREIGRAHV